MNFVPKIEQENLNVDKYSFDSIFAVILSALFWITFYLVVKLFLPTKQPEYCCRVVTFFHGLTVSVCGLTQCFVSNEWPFSHPEWPTTGTQSFLLVLSLGYFIFDSAWCIIYQTETMLMMIHHFYSVFALASMLFKGHSGAQATCALGSMELTNPFLQTRWLIRSEGYYPSKLFSCVEIVFITMFFLIRICLGTFFIKIICFEPKNDLDFIVLSVIIYIMSWMFFIHIVKYMYSKYPIIKKTNQ